MPPLRAIEAIAERHGRPSQRVQQRRHTDLPDEIVRHIIDIAGPYSVLVKGGQACTLEIPRTAGRTVKSILAPVSNNLIRVPEDHASIADAIAAAGGIPPLVALVTSGPAGGQEEAAWALGNLAWNNTANRDAIREAGGIAPLVALVRNGDWAGQEQAAATLAKLAQHTAANHDDVVSRLGARARRAERRREQSDAPARARRGGVLDRRAR